MTIEIYKDVVGYEGIYQVSNLGNVKRFYKKNQNGIIIKPINNGRGYYRVGLYKNKKPKYCYIHRLIAECFINNINNYKTVNHINGIKNDNRLENLEWCSYADNNIHALQTGLRVHPSGDNDKRSKKIINIETGEIYQSSLSLSIKLGMNRKTLQYWLCNPKNNKSNYRYL
jgi:hypothetical protein